MKKKILAIPVAMMLTLSMGITASATAIEAEHTPAVDLMENQPAAMPTDDMLLDSAMQVAPEGEEEAMATMPQATFSNAYGEITELPLVGDNGAIRVEDEILGLTDFLFNEYTVILDVNGDVISQDELVEGDMVYVAYVMPPMLTMIYPAQLPTTVVVKLDADVYTAVNANMFDQGGMAVDFSLQLNSTDNAVNLDGSAYEGSLDGKLSVVFYQMATRSLPPQTTPYKIVVVGDYELPEYGVMPIADAAMDAVSNEDIEKLAIVVNGEIVENAKAYYNGSATMVPLRAIVEASGSTVTWDDELKQAIIGSAIYVTPGVNSYSAGRAMPMPLECSPEIVDDSTYVPVSFFTDIVFGEYNVSQGTHDFTISAE